MNLSESSVPQAKLKRIRVWICFVAHTAGIPAFLFEDQTADPCEAETRSCSSFAPASTLVASQGLGGFGDKRRRGLTCSVSCRTLV